MATLIRLLLVTITKLFNLCIMINILGNISDFLHTGSNNHVCNVEMWIPNMVYGYIMKPPTAPILKSYNSAHGSNGAQQALLQSLRQT